MIQFQNCKLSMILLAQSPLIHFQGDVSGATLRGSEMKPKLDRFLLSKVGTLGDSAYINKEKGALNYKVNLCGMGKADVINLADEAYKRERQIIYGEKKRLVFQNVKLEILCMNQELRECIEKYIVEFFAVTNFGYMQGKGFGSFIPKEYLEKSINTVPTDVAKWLKEKTGAKACYAIDFKKGTRLYNAGGSKDFFQCFKEIKDFYTFMKTGFNMPNRQEYTRSYLYQYMHKKSIDNEKFWLKANKIVTPVGRAPIISKDHKAGTARYVRALLGTANHVMFRNPAGNENVMIEDANKQIERLESPIFFKIVNGCVYICADRINENIYGARYTFTNKKARTSGEIAVPTKEELKKAGFSIDEFMEEYVDYYNGKIVNDEGKYLRNAENKAYPRSSVAVSSVNKNLYIKKVGGV